MAAAPYPYIASMVCLCCGNRALQYIAEPEPPPPPTHVDVSLTLLRRLEAATSRLEDMVPTISDPSAATNGVASLPESGLTAPGGDIRGGSGTPQQQPMAPLPPAIDDFDALINGDVKTFVNMSEEIGGLVAEQVGGKGEHAMVCGDG